MSNYCIMRMEKVKTEKHFQDMYNHNFRISQANNADPEKSHLNKVLVDLNGLTYWEAQQRREKSLPAYQNGKAPRKDAVRAFEVMMSRSRTMDSEKFDQEAWEQKNVEWLYKTFGKENVLSVVCHKDEAAKVPHLHAVVVPEIDGRLYAKGYGDFKSLQTSYAKDMECFGLERGREGTKVSHRTLERYYEGLERIVDYRLPQQEKNESLEAYHGRLRELVVDLKMQHYEELHIVKDEVSRSKSELRNLKNELKEQQGKLEAQQQEVAGQLDRFREIMNANKSIVERSERYKRIEAGLENGYFSSESEREACKDLLDDIEQYGKQFTNKELETLALPIELKDEFQGR